MLFVFFNRYPIYIAKPGNPSVVHTSPGEVIADWSNILVNIRVFILFYTHFFTIFWRLVAELNGCLQFCGLTVNHSPNKP